MTSEEMGRRIRACMTPSEPSVRNLAASLARAFPGPFHPAQVVPLCEWVHGEIAYVNDPKGMEYVARPDETLRTRAGDCEDQAILLVNLILAIGGYARVVVGFGETGDGHAWVEVRLGASDPECRSEIDRIRRVVQERCGAAGPMAVSRDGGFHWLVADPTNGSRLGDAAGLVAGGFLAPSGNDFLAFARPTDRWVFEP